jgi:hypothetical protein
MINKLLVLGICIVVFAIYFSSNIKNKSDKEDEYELIKKYLLNDNQLYGYNKPKLWIHIKYEYNSRLWKSFGSRTSIDANISYIQLIMKTIIKHNSDDFNIILIDDDSFVKLIPTWDVDLSLVPEPLKTRYRKLAIYNLLYYYGGIVIPNSFICLKNLKSLYYEFLLDKKPFVAESINKTSNNSYAIFLPNDTIMGSIKNCPIIKEYIDLLSPKNNNYYFIENENEFLSMSNKICIKLNKENKMNVIDGSLIGIKNKENKFILIEDLFENKDLNLVDECFGIYVDDNEILKRNKYNWLCNMNNDQILNTKIAITKYLLT